MLMQTRCSALLVTRPFPGVPCSTLAAARVERQLTPPTQVSPRHPMLAANPCLLVSLRLPRA